MLVSAAAEHFNLLMRRWLDRGRIRMHFDVTGGLEQVLDAYTKLFTGGNLGKVLVRVQPPPSDGG